MTPLTFALMCENASALLAETARKAREQDEEGSIGFWFGDTLRVIKPLAEIIYVAGKVLDENQEMGWPSGPDDEVTHG